MKKNLLLLSSLIFTATLGQAAWAFPLTCIADNVGGGNIYSLHVLKLDLDQRSFAYKIDYYCGYPGPCAPPPAPFSINGKTSGDLDSHLGVILRAEHPNGTHYRAFVTGNRMEISLDTGTQINLMSCR